jgi:hypothetical protein
MDFSLNAVAGVTFSALPLELHALYLDRSRDARPLPRGFTGHVAHPLRSILHRGLPGPLLCAALFLAHERARRLVIGHVLLRGHARNGAADHVESQGRRQRLIGLASGRDPRRLWPGGQ